TEQLRQQFMAQLRQLGYNEREVQRYAKSFDDLTYAINNVPRNITVDANTDPAVRAVEEFLAQTRKKSTSVNLGTAGLPSAATTRALGEQAGDAYAKGWNEAVKRERKLIIQTD